jgi:protein-S-isoprenylcysteine O-methyltransferase Ste14
MLLWFYRAFFPAVWIAFLVYWRIKAAHTKASQRVEPTASALLRILAFVIVIILFSTTLIPLPWLYHQLWLPGLWPFWIGAAVTVAGLLFAIWARVHLSSNWSSEVTIKQDHELITTGPYALVRHPIYTGILTGLLGTAIALSEVRGFIAVGLVFVVLLAKLRREEKWMQSQFGETYATYSHKTTALVPFLF